MQYLKKFILESNAIENVHNEPNQEDFKFYTQFLELDAITVSDLESFVAYITKAEYGKPAPLRRKKGMDVRVGNHIPILGGHAIEVELTCLLHDMKIGNMYSTHIAYESIHPFMDGNGRSGRILWLWQWGKENPMGFPHFVCPTFLQQFYYQTLQASQ